MGFATALYKKRLIHRYDRVSYIKYYTAEDFPGLRADPVAFDSDGNRLKGYFYSYPDCRKETLLIFCHGIGAGHLSYMTEIATLAKAGFPVLAYDNTGCFSSEGKDVGSMSRSLADLDHAIDHLKQAGVFRQYENVYVIGHSWGGFAAGCIPLYQEEIRKTVVISGFLSVESLLRAEIGNMKIPFKEAVLRSVLSFEEKADPAHSGASVQKAMEKGTCRYFIAHSEDDGIVPYGQNAAILRARFPEAEYLILNDRRHSPNYAKDAVDYMTETFGTFTRLVKEKKLKTEEEKAAYYADADWERMTVQDDAFWERVIAFLKD